MSEIRISKNIKITQPLINTKGERVTSLRLEGYFALSEKDNEHLLSYNNIDDKWTIDIDSVIKNITNPIQIQLDALEAKYEALEIKYNALYAKVESEHPTPALLTQVL